MKKGYTPDPIKSKLTFDTRMRKLNNSESEVIIEFLWILK